MIRITGPNQLAVDEVGRFVATIDNPPTGGYQVEWWNAVRKPTGDWTWCQFKTDWIGPDGTNETWYLEGDIVSIAKSFFCFGIWGIIVRARTLDGITIGTSDVKYVSVAGGLFDTTVPNVMSSAELVGELVPGGTIALKLIGSDNSGVWSGLFSVYSTDGYGFWWEPPSFIVTPEYWKRNGQSLEIYFTLPDRYGSYRVDRIATIDPSANQKTNPSIFFEIEVEQEPVTEEGCILHCSPISAEKIQVFYERYPDSIATDRSSLDTFVDAPNEALKELRSRVLRRLRIEKPIAEPTTMQATIAAEAAKQQFENKSEDGEGA